MIDVELEKSLTDLLIGKPIVFDDKGNMVKLCDIPPAYLTEYIEYKDFTFEEFKALDYDGDTPMELALVGALYDGKIDFIEISNAYTRAIERERNISKLRFEEACVCIGQYLNGAFKGENKKKMDKRMIHIFNKTKTLPANIYNELYGYTEGDKKELDDFWELIYGSTL